MCYDSYQHGYIKLFLFNVNVAKVKWCLCPAMWVSDVVRRLPGYSWREESEMDSRSLLTEANLGMLNHTWLHLLQSLTLCDEYNSVVEHATLDKEVLDLIPGIFKTPLKESHPLYPKYLH